VYRCLEIKQQHQPGGVNRRNIAVCRKKWALVLLSFSGVQELPVKPNFRHASITMNVSQQNDFLFSSKYRVWRHVAFWAVYTVIVAFTWQNVGKSFQQNLFNGLVWLPVRMLYCYPLMYWVLPQFLLKGKYTQFAFIILLWAIAGLILNYLFRAYVFIPLQEQINLTSINRNPWEANSFLALTTTAGVTSVIILFKHWMRSQQERMQAEKEKVVSELQLLKAQVHPHFLFNTLNNIYSFSLENSSKTPEMILKLSSLLSYMLYDCKAEEVLLEKEIEVMKNYIDLEKERYDNKIDISVNIEGDVKDKFIAPLLMLPFLENAFKHGTSEQMDKIWLSMDISVHKFTLRCKIANSKNEVIPFRETGIGIQNVKKRLRFLYPGRHELKIADEGSFFVVSLSAELLNYKSENATLLTVVPRVAEKV
jgi:two-component system, LytTR family, sensor histidine kinase AlgZ